MTDIWIWLFLVIAAMFVVELRIWFTLRKVSNLLINEPRKTSPQKP